MTALSDLIARLLTLPIAVGIYGLFIVTVLIIFRRTIFRSHKKKAREAWR